METKHKTYIKAGVIVAVLLLLWYMLTRPKAAPASNPQLSPWQAPFYQVNPGINDTIVNNSSNPNFVANNTLNYYDGTISGLSNKYIPMFGLVGMTAVSG